MFSCMCMLSADLELRSRCEWMPVHNRSSQTGSLQLIQHTVVITFIKSYMLQTHSLQNIKKLQIFKL